MAYVTTNSFIRSPDFSLRGIPFSHPFTSVATGTTGTTSFAGDVDQGRSRHSHRLMGKPAPNNRSAKSSQLQYDDAAHTGRTPQLQRISSRFVARRVPGHADPLSVKESVQHLNRTKDGS
jgi:hypothetical protein